VRAGLILGLALGLTGGLSWGATLRLDAGRVFDVRDFGARGDGRTNDTAPIQAALDGAASVLKIGDNAGDHDHINPRGALRYDVSALSTTRAPAHNLAYRRVNDAIARRSYNCP
jgi:hypothetical protein